MLLYEYQIRDEIERLRAYAGNLLLKFEANAEPSELLRDTENLKMLYQNFNEMVPKEVRGTSNFSRHLWFMGKHLSDGSINACKGDISDICNHDLRLIEEAFRKWCKNQDHYDKELSLAISGLLIRQEFDSAIRKAFVILKSRLCRLFQAPEDLDGPALINLHPRVTAKGSNTGG
jgi:hypothetical protein